jgi:ubiquinone/menaquinone biosynthesis C-methylase UbiE
MAGGRLRRAGESRVPLVRGRAQALPFGEEMFDCVLSTFPTDFLLMAETLGAVYGVLRPGGRYVVVIAGFMAGSGPLVRFLEWLYRVTGQRGGGEEQASLLEESPLWLRAKERFETAGFAARLERVKLEGSEALVIVAEKVIGD